jgi:hypothetical protein
MKRSIGSALASSSIRRSTASARIDISRGQHVQQGRPTAGATRTHSSTNPGNRPRIHEPIMHWCVLLGFRIIHRQKPPKEKRDPKYRSTLHHSLGPRGTRIPLSTAVLATVTGCSTGTLTRVDQLASTTGYDAPCAAKARPTLRSDRSLEAVPKSPNQSILSSDNSEYHLQSRHFLAIRHRDNLYQRAETRSVIASAPKFFGTTPLEV